MMQGQDSSSRLPKAVVAAAPLFWKLTPTKASSARLVVLAYFRLLQQIKSPPFVDPELQRIDRESTRRALAAISTSVPLLQLALRHFAQDTARV